MTTRERMTEMRGAVAVAVVEGAQLGSVHRILLDTASLRIVGFSLRHNVLGRESFVPSEAVTLVGEDVLFVKDRASLAPAPPAGVRSLKDLQGLPVATLEGKGLGGLVDLDVEPGRWAVTSLRLSDGTAIPTDGGKVVLGEDTVLVDPELASRGKKEGSPQGFLSRMFGAEALEETARVIRRTFGRREAGEDKKQP